LVYDQGMPVSVNLQTVHPRQLAAVRREVAPGAVGSAQRPALDEVWEFIRSQPGLRTVIGMPALLLLVALVA
jgi:hypothetical protein